MALHVAVLSGQTFQPPGNSIRGSIEGDHARAVAMAGARVAIISVNADSNIRGSLGNRTIPEVFPGNWIGERGGFPVVERRVLPMWHGPWERRAVYWPKAALKALERYVRTHGKPDVIHAHLARYAGLACSDIRRAHGIPYVLTEHSSAWGTGAVGHSELAVLRRAFSDASEVIAVSRFLGDTLVELGVATDVTVIPNPVDDRFAGVSPPPEGRSFLFISVGALREVKGFDLLIEAFAEAFADQPDVSLRIIGDGQERDRLEKLVVRLGMVGRIEMPGGVPKAQMPAEIAAAHAMVSASRYETFGVAIIEALAAGRPVIATRCGGPETTVGATDGVLVPVDDKASMVQAMKDVKTSKWATSEISTRAEERFGIEKVGAALHERLTAATR